MDERDEVEADRRRRILGNGLRIPAVVSPEGFELNDPFIFLAEADTEPFRGGGACLALQH